MTKEQKILLLLVLVACGAGATYYVTQGNANTIETPAAVTDQPTVTTPTPVTTNPATTTGGTVAAGKTLTQTEVYAAPEGNSNQITVTVVLDQNGVISDVKFDYATPRDHQSKERLASFAAAFSPSMVLGKKLSDVSLSRVGGSSLTTKAFNKAIADLAAKA
jgi:hypothetical protein